MLAKLESKIISNPDFLLMGAFLIITVTLKLNPEKRSMDVIRRVTLAMGNQTLEIQSAIRSKIVGQDDISAVAIFPDCRFYVWPYDLRLNQDL